MKPLFSNEERCQAVKNFIVARYHNQAKITSFSPLVPYLNESRVIILCKLKKSRQGNAIRDAFGNFKGYERFYTETDSETYFEWLVAVVTGAENVQEAIVKQANDQLFQFIHVLGDNIQKEKNVQLLAPYDWQKLFMSFDERLTDMQRIIDKGDKDIAEVLKSILQMIKKNITLLEILCKESEELFGKGT